MKKITANDAETRSADVVAENLEHLKSVFPEVFNEGKVDFEVLRQLLGSAVDDRDEKYGLSWHGKRQARQLALTPSTGTLRPCPEESVDWDTTQNLMIEGDNLEVLKLLQKSYAGKVKLIYIDPPYNTGRDFVYRDDYRDSMRNYLELTGQADGENRKLSSNTEASGRFHTDWLNMMYPRLKVARSLLAKGGVVAVSADDAEQSNLQKLCDEIFGEENFIALLVWKSRISEDTRATTGVSSDHEYIICYARDEGTAFRGAEKNTQKFSNPDNDPRGPWRSADLTGLATRDARPNLHYDLVDPDTRVNYGCPPKGWRFERATMDQKILESVPKVVSGPDMWYSELVATPLGGDHMPWNRTTRKDYKRDGRRYESDVTDKEWAIVESMLPKQGPLGRPRETDLREVFNAIQYVLATGCQWRALPGDFPPYSTVINYFYRWQGGGVFDRMMDAFRDLARGEAGRRIEPTAAIIDSQSVKTTESGGSRGYDGGKKVVGRKRHITVDVEGSPIVVEVHAASVQDRDGAPAVIVALLEVAVCVKKLFADSAYAGPKLQDALKELGVSELIEIVPKPKGAKGFTVLSRRWVVERTFAWMGRCRRLAKDVERTVASSVAWVKLAGCRFMMRRVARRQRPRMSSEIAA